MQRYKVTIVSNGATGERPVLLVPFEPSAMVTAFVDELWKRIRRQGISLEPNTHVATLHLDSETGALIDVEDVLSDVVTDPKNENIFAVFTKKDHSPTGAGSINEITPPARVNGTSSGEETISIRVVTPQNAKDKSACSIIHVPVKSTIRQLHDRIAELLQIRPKFEKDADVLECNCKLANLLADGACAPNEFYIVHGKSVVERLDLKSPTEQTLKETLRARFGVDVESEKKVALVGSVPDLDNTALFKKPPVVSICSRQRHTPAHARTEVNETGRTKYKVLDLHTSELPIHPSSMSSTIEEAGLGDLSVNGSIDVFCVYRTTTGSVSSAAGKSNIFRQSAHWIPRVQQSDRGVAMFLSSLRVFTSLVQDMSDDERSQDAVLHVFDLLTKFPPALRALHILVSGKTPTASESAAISHAMFEILDDFMPTDVIGSDHTRVFEGARLLFGFILEKARGLKLPAQEGAATPYLSSLRTFELRDQTTNEAVRRVVQTSNGVIEADLFHAFQQGGLLHDSHLQTYPVKIDANSTQTRQAILAGGSNPDITVFSARHLSEKYGYRDSGNVVNAFELDELSELDQLAEFCGRNKLAVHKPNQLSSAITPCLTFDRSAHLAVYTGEQPCGTPGQSSIIFRPMHGEETIDASIVEQLIAPLLQKYEAEGSAVFDALGGATIRRLQAPDEILMFAVDTSASMRQATDFAEVNDDLDMPTELSEVHGLVEPDFYNLSSFDEMKERLCGYEGFQDMIGIVSDAAETGDERYYAGEVLESLRTFLSTEIVKKAKDLADRRQYARGWHYARNQIKGLEAELKKLKTFWAGLKTHEEAICDFLIYRASYSTSDLSQHWSWSIGDDVPSASPSRQIPTLETDVIELPHHLRCPISHTLMEDAVTAADGMVYSHVAIDQWFSIRHSSPMTGLQLNDTSLTTNQDICDAAARWIDGDGVPGRQGGESKRLRSSNELNVTFDGKVGSFQRRIAPTMSLQDLYRLAFRGLKARYTVFQLSTEKYGPLTPHPEAAVSSRGIKAGDHINIRIADDDPTAANSDTSRRASELVLIKVYNNPDHMLFGFWVKKDTSCTLASVLWKYQRSMLIDFGDIPRNRQVWIDMENSGDNLMRGTPLPHYQQLSTYLMRTHCTGILGDEPVYRQQRTSGNEGTLVMKIMMSNIHKPEMANNKLTRLDVLKQVFEALINRMLAYNYKTHVGMITFASTCQVATGISHVLENFRKSTAKMTADGDTALWDALSLAKDQLVEYGKKYPDAKKRIICISDGVDTKSTSNTSAETCWRLRTAQIAVDSVCLGEEENEDLRTLSYLLGCYRFHPTSLVNALAICEMEPFLSLSERPDITPPANTPDHRLQFISRFASARRFSTPTVVTDDVIPPRKLHPNLHDEFVELSAVASRPRGSFASGTSARANRRIARLMNEMRQIANGDHPTWDVYVSETDMSFWKVVLSGPEGSPYEEGVFLLYLHAEENYPVFAPKARFITKIKHPNVNMHGRICHSIFDRDWTSDTSMTTLLDTVYGLLLQPEFSDPVNTTTTLGFHHDQVEFADEVREHVDRYASQTRAEWKAELLGEDDGDDGEGGDDEMEEDVD